MRERLLERRIRVDGSSWDAAGCEISYMAPSPARSGDIEDSRPEATSGTTSTEQEDCKREGGMSDSADEMLAVWGGGGREDETKKSEGRKEGKERPSGGGL